MKICGDEGKRIVTKRVKEDHPKPYRLYLILFLLSFGINLIFLGLFLEERIPWRSLLQERKGAREGQQGKWAEGMVPTPIIHVKPQEYFLLCEKNAKTLSLFHSEPNRLTLMKSYSCIVGSNNGDKREAGDLATPEGIYFLVPSYQTFLKGTARELFRSTTPTSLIRRRGKRAVASGFTVFPIIWNGRSIRKDALLSKMRT